MRRVVEKISGTQAELDLNPGSTTSSWEDMT